MVRLKEDGVFADRRGVGVRRSAARLVSYELGVIAEDVADVVRSAGGWLGDRVRAGWGVTVCVPDHCDVLPLHILGVEIGSVGRTFESVRRWTPAALAVSTQFIANDEQLRRDLLKIMGRDNLETTLWGDHLPEEFGGHVERTRHRMSRVARSFKAHAEVAAGFHAHRATSNSSTAVAYGIGPTVQTSRLSAK